MPFVILSCPCSPVKDSQVHVIWDTMLILGASHVVKHCELQEMGRLYKFKSSLEKGREHFYEMGTNYGEYGISNCKVISVGIFPSKHTRHKTKDFHSLI